MNDYETKLEDRRERLIERAESKEREADSRHSRVREMSRIMNGQPILIGHHSEKRHRRDIERMDTNMRKGCEATEEAKRLRERARGVGRGGISSDDPEAIQKLKEKLQSTEKLQEVMKGVNRIIRRKPKNEQTSEKLEALGKLGIPAGRAQQLFEPDFVGRIGFANYALSNNNANMRRIRERITTLEQAPTETVEKEVDGIRIVEDAEDNRLRLIFPDKPCDSVRKELKRSGFRWSPSTNAWQRHLNNGARYAAERVLEIIKNEIPEGMEEQS